MLRAQRGRYFILIAIAILTQSSVVSAVEFPIFSYFPPQVDSADGTAQIDSAYNLIASFGLNQIWAMAKDIAFRRLSDRNIRFVSTSGYGYYPGDAEQWRELVVKLTEEKPWYLSEYAYWGAYFTGLSTNTNYRYGYKYAATTGGTFVDFNAGGNSVLRARAGVDDPGTLYAFAEFSEMAQPVRHYYNRFGTPTTMVVRLRINDLSGDSNTVVAQMSYTNTWGINNICDTIDHYNYYTELHNDSLFVWYIYNSPCPGTVDTIYTQIIPPAGIFDTTFETPQYFLPSPDSGLGYSDTHTFHVCWQDSTGDTICEVPRKYLKDLHLYEFGDTIYYHDFILPHMSHATSGGDGIPWYNTYRSNYWVTWPGDKTLYLDTVMVYNDTGLTLAQNSKSSIAAELDDYCDYWNAASGDTGRWPIPATAGWVPAGRPPAEGSR